MNQRDDTRGQDHGWVDPAGTGLLAQTLGAMAGGVDPTSPTGPAAVLPVMTRRVRRRRTAKVGGLGGGALALAAVLVLGATQFAPTDRSEPLPATSSSSPSPTPEIQLQEGYQPDMLTETNLACGAQLADVELSEDTRLEATGPLLTSVSGTTGEWSYSESVPVRPVDSAGGDITEDGLNWPTLVWVDEGGTVVDVGAWDPFPFNNREGAPATDAYDDRTSSCAVEGAELILPDGAYDVYAMTLRDSSGPLIASGPIPVVVQDGARLINRGGIAAPIPFEVPEDPDNMIVQDGGVNSEVLDRTGEWERRVSYQVHTGEDFLPEDPYVVEAQCTATEAGTSIGFEVIGDWSGAEPTGSVACDGERHVVGTWTSDGLPLSASGGTRVELTDVPDGVALAYVRLVPEASAEG